jgi:hypothetical protein
VKSEIRRMQWGVRGVLTLGVAASVSANILHAQHDLIAQCIAAWPPVALLITVEMVSRIPISGRAWTVIRIGATLSIAGIAAWISYWHMAGVVARYGEVGSVPYLLPVSVDGLIVAASVSLVELAGRAREQRASEQATDQLATAAVRPEHGEANSEPVPAVEPGDRWPIDQHANDDPGDAGPHLDDPTDLNGPESEDDSDTDGLDIELAADLVPLLPAARAARAELTRDGAALTRDALARRLRRNGVSIRNDRVSELLSALRTDTGPVNGNRPTASV